jgi:hypothetical protein
MLFIFPTLCGVGQALILSNGAYGRRIEQIMKTIGRPSIFVDKLEQYVGCWILFFFLFPLKKKKINK